MRQERGGPADIRDLPQRKCARRRGWQYTAAQYAEGPSSMILPLSSATAASAREITSTVRIICLPTCT